MNGLDRLSPPQKRRLLPCLLYGGVPDQLVQLEGTILLGLQGLLVHPNHAISSENLGSCWAVFQIQRNIFKKLILKSEVWEVV
jgi:hypothetical protein